MSRDNQRQIKFRALSSGIFVSTGQREWLELYPGYDESRLYEEDTLGQYTGLKDKNGVEIYEGDIVRIYYRGSEQRIASKGWVEYVDARFIVKSTEDSKKPYFLCFYARNQEQLFNWSESEVIGNLYENPELLEKS